MFHNSHTLFPSVGPMASTEHSKELEEVGSMRTPLRQNPARAGRSQRPSGWRRRRPRLCFIIHIPSFCPQVQWPPPSIAKSWRRWAA
uniref:Uncharacterized protein n=1 Tax=Sinocyclocheilus rhinocerous TaxID=307959 RepID=A0A673KQE5_9TELE